MPASRLMRALRWLWRYRWPLGLFVAAAALRLWWNLSHHPPEEHAFSDMGGYVNRAKRLATTPWLRRPDEAFYPIGTHYIIGAFYAVFGSMRAAGVGFALISALGAPLAYALMGRLHGGADWSERTYGTRPSDPLPEREALRHKGATRLAKVLGLALVVYFPSIGYAGFFLSETPFMVLLTASALWVLRLADQGRRGDAWVLGILFAVGLLVRPQIIVAAGLVMLWFVWRRRAFALLGFGHLLRAVIPVALAMAYLLTLSGYHNGRPTPMAQNGGLNRAFGRCHAYEISSYHSRFGPPAFGSLHRLRKRDRHSLLPLAPAINARLEHRGTVWDEEDLNALADRCIHAKGLSRQAYFAFSHVVVLWGFNAGWPWMGDFPAKNLLAGFSFGHLFLFGLPMLVAMGLGASREESRLGLVSLYAWSMLLTVMLVMGSVRFRVPYDIVTVALGMHVYGRLIERLVLRFRARRRARALGSK
jgi:hypothetical protein